MTAQIPDTIKIDGRVWFINSFDADQDLIPSNEELGIETVMQHTANWSGRINHYLVYRDKLYLFKLEVNMDKSHQDIVPEGARREVVIRYVPYSRDFEGKDKFIREEKTEYLIFDNLSIPYTGAMELELAGDDIWNQPWPIEDTDRKTVRATAEFVTGELVDFAEYE